MQDDLKNACSIERSYIKLVSYRENMPSHEWHSLDRKPLYSDLEDGILKVKVKAGGTLLVAHTGTTQEQLNSLYFLDY